MLVLGAVAYANAEPLLEGLAEEPGVRLLRETPAALARLLDAGELDAALLPVVHLFRNPGLLPVGDGGIASEGPVESVCLFGRAAPGPGARILLDDSSLTSAALARILLAGPLGAPGATFAPCPPDTDPRAADADGVLLIGDAALRVRRGGLHAIDLGEAWTAWTGLPFVWAAWGARTEAAAAAAAPLLDRARARGLRDLDAVADRAAARLGLPAEDLRRYLRERIRHVLGPAERRGADRFRALL
jgi:chorismate dehydratase